MVPDRYSRVTRPGRSVMKLGYCESHPLSPGSLAHIDGLNAHMSTRMDRRDGSVELVAEFVNLSGTHVNCAGTGVGLPAPGG